MYKIKFYGFPASGKSTHLSKWLQDEIEFAVINDSLLRGPELKKSPLDKQRLVLERFQVSDDKRTKLVVDHSPIEMIEWFTLYHNRVEPFPKEDFKEIQEIIESKKMEEKETFDKIFHVYFMANKRTVIRNMEQRSRLNEKFDEQCYNFISDNIIMDFARKTADQEATFEIRCRRKEYREDVILSILFQIDENQISKFSPEDFA